MDGVLQGVKVIELANWAAAPSACAILADWGAEVIKVESPRGGDPMRGQTSLENIELREANFWFEQTNRNKRSIAVDLNKEAGRKVLYKLVRSADVFVSNLQATAITALKVDYDTLRKINPRLVYAHFSGYGEVGPDRDKPGFDHIAFWARSGIMDRMQVPEASPSLARPASGDNISSMGFAGAIAAALFARERTGKGQQVTASLYASGIWALSWDIQVALNLGQEISQTDRRVLKNPLRGIYKTRDNRWIHFMMPQLGRYWAPFCKAIGREDLLNAPGKKERSFVVSNIEEVIATRTYAEWDEILTRHGLIFDVLRSPIEIANDPQAWANQMFAEIDHPNYGRMRMIASPFRFNDSPNLIRSPAPALGQHTEEVLLEIGYTWTDLARLKEEGAIP